MKSTLILLAAFFTFIATWMLLAFIGWCLSETATFRQIACNNGLIMLLLVVGWIPSVIVGIDLDETLR